MSYFIDPWLYNCAANPADSPAAQLEQRTIIAATTRALDYARSRGRDAHRGGGQRAHGHRITPTVDSTSPPDYPFPPPAPRTRRAPTVDNSCVTMPSEGPNVVNGRFVRSARRSARPTTPTTAVEQADVAAPGGDSPRHARRLAPDREHDPRRLPVRGRHQRGPRGRRQARHRPGHRRARPAPAVIKQGGAYYQYIQGTSMASPHAVGVAALIVAEYGKRDRRNGGADDASPTDVERDPQAAPPPTTACPARSACRPTPCVADGAAGGLHRDVRGLAAAQRVLRRRHRRRARRGPRRQAVVLRLRPADRRAAAVSRSG